MGTDTGVTGDMDAENVTTQDRIEDMWLIEAMRSLRQQWDNLTQRTDLSPRQESRMKLQFFKAGKDVLVDTPHLANKIFTRMETQAEVMTEPFRGRVARHLNILKQNAGMK